MGEGWSGEEGSVSKAGQWLGKVGPVSHRVSHLGEGGHTQTHTHTHTHTRTHTHHELI